LPPIQECCEFYSLDAAGDAKSQEQPIKVCLHGSTRHVELPSDFVVIAALQQQLDNLLLSLPQTYGPFAH
jgi:hypothetical protein